MRNLILANLKKIETSNKFLLLVAMSFSITPSAYSAGTAAGTLIKNHVEVSYQVGSDSSTVYLERATDVFTVSELIRSNVSALEPQGVGAGTPASNAVLSFQVTNTGNGNEPFLLTTREGMADQFKPIVIGLWIESNGQPGWQADDTLYQPSSGGVPLAADQSETIYVVSDIPENLSDGSKSDVTLVSTSGTQGASSKLMGNSLDGLGDGGIEAVIAQNNARHQDMTHYTVSTVKLDVEKSILSIKDPYGTELSMPGSEVTYKIRLVASGTGTANNLVIDDAVPESMTYKINTMTVDGNAMSDRQDNDIARFDNDQKIAYFSPGVITSPATHEYTLTYIID
jgi:uncharacterized repeat protein (TIGR01451 family)